MNAQTITLAQLSTACQNAAYINVHLYTPAMSSLSTFKPDQIRFMSASTGVPLLRFQSKTSTIVLQTLGIQAAVTPCAPGNEIPFGRCTYSYTTYDFALDGVNYSVNIFQKI